ncbi:MAG: signal peptidase II [Alphaproteobacteria bacterium]
MSRSLRLGFLIASIVIFMDQLSKWLVSETLPLIERKIVVTPFFNIVELWNRGVSFGIFNNAAKYTPYFLIALTLVIVGFLLFWLKKENNKGTIVALGFIIGGALGNLIDRIRFQAVYDFIDVYIGSYHWPAFNIADAAVCVGALYLILESFTDAKKK